MDQHDGNATDHLARQPILSDRRLRELAPLKSPRGRLDCILVKGYLESARSRLLDLQAMIDTGEPEAIRKVAHRWRGAAASIGLDALASVLEVIELQPAHVATVKTRLEDTTTQSEVALRAYLLAAGDAGPTQAFSENAG